MSGTSDPVRRAVDRVAVSDSDREVTLRSTTLRADIPLPGGKRAVVEVIHNSAKISGKGGRRKQYPWQVDGHRASGRR